MVWIRQNRIPELCPRPGGRCGFRTIIEETSGTGDVFFALTGDHSTPCEIGEHSADPLPVVISGRGVLRDSVRSYGEHACSSGSLGRLTGNQFLLSILDLIDVTYRFGS